MQYKIKRRVRFAQRKRAPIEGLESSVAFFSNANKAATERAAVDDLSRIRAAGFAREKLVRPHLPPDVRATRLAFEVEI